MRTFRGTLNTRWSLALVTCLLLTLALPLTPAHAATLTVTKLADDNTAGTLRKAITDAAAGDTITFQAGLTGSLKLTDQLVVDKKLIIQGPGANMLAVRGDGKDRVLFVPGTGNVTISGLMIADGVAQGGFAGGGIANDGVLTVMGCGFTNDVTNGGFSGGGIFSRGTLTVTNSTFLSNSAANGGGIFTGGGTLMLANSTFFGNQATANGGAIGNFGGALTLRNITAADNPAAGGGGIFQSSGSLDIGNSLLTANSSPTGADLDITGGTVMSQGNNFISNIAGTFPMQMSDIISNGATVLAPQPADNGGPTQTLALLPGSAPVDKGSNTLCADPLVGNKDQRGITRPQGATCDIGAFEVQQTGMPMTPAMMGMNPTMTMTACAPFAPGSPFAFAPFQSQWQMGEGLTPNFWGPSVSGALMEQYVETGGARLVQYFDKGRMERGVNDAVTNGLLANELITGQMQVGDNAFMARGAANIPVAGDPDNAGPTYAGLGTKGMSLFATTTNRSGGVVTSTVAANGTVTAGGMMTGSGPTAISAYDGTTQHNVPQAFADYRAKAGLSSIGLAKSEAFLTTVKVGGMQKQVMVQVFERRVLTYTAANAPAFQVEMGNIGQHYYRWRYCGA